MEKVFVSYVTEYEAGWGSKLDGIAMSRSLNSLKKYIVEQTKNQKYEYFWTYSEPVEMVTDSIAVEKLSPRKVREYSKIPKGNWYKNVVA